MKIKHRLIRQANVANVIESGGCINSDPEQSLPCITE